jgi:3-dehydroquinate synthase
MAEVIKYALIADSEFWQELQSTPQPIPLEEWIARCVRLKAHVVAQDELETKGVRAILNFGHTVGHAIEQVSGYGTYLHGEAVAVGMMVATFLSEKIYGIDLLEPLRRVLTAYQLPTQARGLSITAIKEAILRDKKSDGKAVTWVLLKSVGQTEQTQNMPDALLDQALRAFIQEPLP